MRLTQRRTLKEGDSNLGRCAGETRQMDRLFVIRGRQALAYGAHGFAGPVSVERCRKNGRATECLVRVCKRASADVAYRASYAFSNVERKQRNADRVELTEKAYKGRY